MRHMKMVRRQAVTRHQQPARQALFNHVKTVAGGSLGNLQGELQHIGQHHLAQRGRSAEFRGEYPGLHAHGRTGALHQGTKRRSLRSQRTGHATHTLATHQCHRENLKLVHPRQQRQQGSAGEINVAHQRSDLTQDLALGQLDHFKLRQ